MHLLWLLGKNIQENKLIGGPGRADFWLVEVGEDASSCGILLNMTEFTKDDALKVQFGGMVDEDQGDYPCFVHAGGEEVRAKGREIAEVIKGSVNYDGGEATVQVTISEADMQQVLSLKQIGQNRGIGKALTGGRVGRLFQITVEYVGL